MADLSIHDIQQLYHDNLLRYKGEIVKVAEIISAKSMMVMFLKTRETKEVPFKQEYLTPIAERIGFVNAHPQAVYIARRARRTFSIGITNQNCIIRSAAPGIPTNSVTRLTHRGIVDAIEGNYPSIKEALTMLDAPGTVVAFDKQFAIDYDRNIYFKTEGVVGKLRKPYRTIERIEWNKGNDMYQFLLEPNYEKTVRTFEDQAN
jgi:hypothetical protein